MTKDCIHVQTEEPHPIIDNGLSYQPSTSEDVVPETHLGSTECFYSGILERLVKWQKFHKLVIGNWKITSFTGKEHEVVEDAKLYFLDVVSILLVKRCGSNVVELDNGWKLIYTDIERSLPR